MEENPINSDRKVVSDSADVCVGGADLVGARRGQAGGAGLDNVGAVVRRASSAAQNNWKIKSNSVLLGLNLFCDLKQLKQLKKI